MNISAILFLVMLSVSTLGVAYADSKSESAAIKSAQDWLSLVDAAKYEESWEQASSLFKNAVPRENWVQAIHTARDPFGELIQRKLKSKKFATTLPGAPDGSYVVIEYETSFKNKKSAIETITPMLDKDGKWKVSGYYIK